MTFLGIILFIIGALAAGLLFTGNAPSALMEIPVPDWGWVILALLGALLIYFNRRPAN